MNKCQVNIKVWQVNIKIWQDDMKICKIYIIIWQVMAEICHHNYHCRLTVDKSYCPFLITILVNESYKVVLELLEILNRLVLFKWKLIVECLNYGWDFEIILFFTQLALLHVDAVRLCKHLVKKTYMNHILG